MIDFRYHLVSLAAVLIALAIGIVLGAGPLRDDIGTTLNNQVTQLRGEKEDLRRDLGEAQRGAEGRDVYDEATLSRVVDGRLADRRVTVVTLPQADDRLASDIGESVQAAGGTLVGTVSLDPSWVSPEDAAEAARRDVGADALRDLGAEAGSSEPVDRALGVLLTGRVDGREVEEEPRATAWDRLTDADLVGSPGDAPESADLLVVVGAPLAPDGGAGSEESRARGEATARRWVRLARSLDESSSGVVLTEPSARASEEDVSLVTTARAATSLAQGVSTVDVPELPMGRAGVVLALEQQLDGESGHYGLGQDAAAPVPDLS